METREIGEYMKNNNSNEADPNSTINKKLQQIDLESMEKKIIAALGEKRPPKLKNINLVTSSREIFNLKESEESNK